MKRNRSSLGFIYKPKYRTRSGEIKTSPIWWIGYSHHDVKYRESSKSEKRADASVLLKQRLGQAGLGQPISSAMRRTTLDDLASLVFTDYRNNQFDTLARQEDAFRHLREFFGGDCPAEEITGSRISQYIEWRRQQPNELYTRRRRTGCADATINRELAALRHAFRLASEQDPPLVTRVPAVKLLKERNRRTGFFEWGEFAAIREHLPDYLKPVMTVAYYTGWRCASELLTRERRHIKNGMLVLEPYEAKSEEPRLFPLDVIPELREVIEQQLEATRQLELETGRVINLLFHNRGKPIVDYRRAWHKACAAAGLSGKIPHDFRRTAARNLVQVTDPFTACRLVGWKEMDMLKRYNIIDDETLKAAGEKLGSYVDKQKRRAVVKVAAMVKVQSKLA